MASLPSPKAIRKLQHALLEWFRRARRSLPWRRDRDPYRIWVSEMMLHQTQVVTVIPYFERFIAEFPTVADLAAADLQQVLRVWEGLGYYRRARDMHRAARLIVAQHSGVIPRNAAALQALPGFGRYTAGAVLSQAFDEKLPIVEANSRRVLCRLLAYEGDPQCGAGARWLWSTAEALLPEKDVGDFNQALMELGALVCTWSAPRCEECPVRKECAANRLGLQEQLPIRRARPSVVAVKEVAVIIRRGQNVFLAKRPSQGRWAEMWEFPRTELRPSETHRAAAQRLLGAEIGFDCELGRKVAGLRHQVTNHRIALLCLESQYRRGRFRAGTYITGQWIRPEKLLDFPLSAAQRRIALTLGGLTKPHEAARARPLRERR
jgi:A/G-specific adenine glycosylase